MKRFSFFLLLLFFPYFIVQAAPRKKVALVLSGGGAKGAAHVGVLKVVDKKKNLGLEQPNIKE